MNIINALPGILPTARPYTMGQWPQRSMRMRNGRNVRWGLSSRQDGDRMELSWENITYGQAEQICAIWDANYGIAGDLVLPPEAFAGTDTSLGALLALPFPNAVWQFAGPPQVASVKARRCTVRIPIKTRFTPLLSYAFSDIYGFGPAEPGKALVAPEIQCPPGCTAEFRLIRDNEVITTNKTLYYVLGPNDLGNGKIKVRWQYRCNCPGKPEEAWKDATSRGRTVAHPEPVPQNPWQRPGREYEFYWRVNVLRFGFIGGLDGWRPASTLVRVQTIGDPFDYLPLEGPPTIPAIRGDVFEVNTSNGTSQQIVFDGTFFFGQRWAYVEKTRYSDNGGPYVDGEDYSGLS